MADLGLHSVRRAESPLTRSLEGRYLADLIRYHFEALAPGWAVGRRHSPASGRYPLLCARTFSGWGYVAFAR